MNIKNDMEIVEIAEDELRQDLLKYFNRYQEVNLVWRIIDGEKVLKENRFIEEWDENLKQEIINEDFTICLKHGGAVYGAFHGGKMIAFAALLHDFFGTNKQYLQLMQLHVSNEYREFGIGKRLFYICADKAREWGAEKLYISSHSAEETQGFYKSLGCVDAVEINKRLAEHEPCDIQLEYVL